MKSVAGKIIFSEFIKKFTIVAFVFCALITPVTVKATPYNIIDIDTNSIIDIDNIIDIDSSSFITNINGIIDIDTDKIIDIPTIIDSEGIIDIDTNSIIDIEGNHIIDIDGIIDIDNNKLDMETVGIIDIEGNMLYTNDIAILNAQSNITIVDDDFTKSDADFKTVLLIEYFGNFEIPIKQTAPIPEPATILLFSSGLFGLFGLKKFRKR